MAIEFTDSSFDKEVLQSSVPVLVDFWAPWCGPCRMMLPVIDQLHEKYKDNVKIGKVNVDENQQTATKYGIMSIPAIKIFKNGAIVKEFIGLQNADALSKEIDALL
ncbi:MAG: thioredoxin [Patescibacteria group bacterium]|nr:thioredoxin [Patescibacteria group bacterium]